MSKEDITPIYNRVKLELENHRMLAAIDQLRALAGTVKAPWQIKSKIDMLSESYNLLKGYAINGVEDPQRAELYSGLASEIRSIAAELIRYWQLDDSPRQYFGVLRYEAMQDDSSLGELLEKLRAIISRISMARFKGTTPSDAIGQQDRLTNRLFNYIWTRFPLSADDERSILGVFEDEAIPDWFKDLTVSAVMLGALHFYDERRLYILASVYLTSKSEQIEMRALTALLLAMWGGRRYAPQQRFRKLMESVREKPSWDEDLRMTYLELVRTRDTERVSRTMRDELFPAMMKLKPDIERKMRDISDPEDLGSIEENPEWEEMFEKTGLSQKLREISELQMEGADIMMSTMSDLKHFPFFNDVSSWFMPYYPEQSTVTRISGGGDLGEFIGKAPMLCDSDKYSLLLSLEHVPKNNRRFMMGQMESQNIDFQEMENSELNPDKNTRKGAVNKYIQNLYRFFNLYRRKSEFPNPFAKPVNLCSIPLLAQSLEKGDALTLVSEFYFRKGYYREASDTFDLIINRQSPSAQVYQKKGYCLQKLSDMTSALDNYKKAEMLKPGSLWTLRRMAQAYRTIGDTAKALEYYQQVYQADNNDLSSAINIGHCLMEQGHYQEAMKYYFKVEFLSAKQRQAQRAIAWCAFLSGDLERSAQYFDKILSDQPTANDYLNIGHLKMAQKQYREAINYYRLSRDNSEDKSDATLISSIEADRGYLIAADVDPLLLDIVIDTVANE